MDKNKKYKPINFFKLSLFILMNFFLFILQKKDLFNC